VSEYPRPTGETSSDELDLVSLFHRLRRASAAGTRALSPREERLLEMIRELFEPRTVAEARPHGKPVRPPAGGRSQAGRGAQLGPMARSGGCLEDPPARPGVRASTWTLVSSAFRRGLDQTGIAALTGGAA
jgi:hypothetical protein